MPSPAQSRAETVWHVVVRVLVGWAHLSPSYPGAALVRSTGGGIGRSGFSSTVSTGGVNGGVCRRLRAYERRFCESEHMLGRFEVLSEILS